MSNELAVVDQEGTSLTPEETNEFSTFTLDGQLIGIPVLDVQDVLNSMPLTKIPLAGSEIAGLLNLRGRIVTAIDMRTRLGLPILEKDAKQMSIVVEKNEELYSLLVDKIGDVINIPTEKYEPNPANLDQVWSNISSGVYRLKNQIMVVLDTDKLLEYTEKSEDTLL